MPSPNDPVEAHIVLSVARALKGICGEGFHYEVDENGVSVKPADRRALYLGDTAHEIFFVVEALQTRREGRGYGSVVLDRAVVQVSGAVAVSRLGGAEWALAPAKIAADVEKALMVDRTRCGLAAETHVLPAQTFDGEDRVIVELQVECTLFPRVRGTQPAASCECFSVFC